MRRQRGLVGVRGFGVVVEEAKGAPCDEGPVFH